jgi:hypothetical protein
MTAQFFSGEESIGRSSRPLDEDLLPRRIDLIATHNPAPTIRIEAAVGNLNAIEPDARISAPLAIPTTMRIQGHLSPFAELQGMQSD